MTKGNKNKVWGTRVKKPTSKLLQSINSSIDIDKRLFNEDIDASIAHCEMLSKQKIINSESAKKALNRPGSEAIAIPAPLDSNQSNPRVNTLVKSAVCWIKFLRVVFIS